MNDDREQTRAALIAQVIAAPEDDGPRLVFADWLLEQGDARGRFITLQCALKGKLSKGHRRTFSKEAAELLGAHREKWCLPARAVAAAERCLFRRGFIEQLETFGDRFVEHGAELLEVEPVRGIQLTFGSTEGLESLAESGLLAKIRWLKVQGDICDDGAAALAEAPELEHIERLNLDNAGIESEGVARLAEGDRLKRCRVLALTGNPIGSEGAAHLANSTALGACESLFLARAEIGDEGVRALAEARSLQNLTTLGLDANPDIDDEAVIALLGSPSFPKLKRIELANIDLAFKTHSLVQERLRRHTHR